MIVLLLLNLGIILVKIFLGFFLKKDKFLESDIVLLNIRLLYLVSIGILILIIVFVIVVFLLLLLIVIDIVVVYGSFIVLIWLYDILYKKEMGEDCKLIFKLVL